MRAIHASDTNVLCVVLDERRAWTNIPVTAFHDDPKRTWGFVLDSDENGQRDFGFPAPRQAPATPPRFLEMVHGCRHSTACGAVRSVRSVSPTPRVFTVVEDYGGRVIDVKREADGALYEVRWAMDFGD